MKSLFLLTALLVNISSPATARQPDTTRYAIVVSFQSICCGVPSDTAIINFISKFKKQNKIKKITAYHIGPIGREGEFKLAFTLKELTKKQSKAFITKIKMVKPLATDKGTFSFLENERFEPGSLPKRATAREVIF